MGGTCSRFAAAMTAETLILIIGNVPALTQSRTRAGPVTADVDGQITQVRRDKEPAIDNQDLDQARRMPEPVHRGYSPARG
jgi:hypothetical protein